MAKVLKNKGANSVVWALLGLLVLGLGGFGVTNFGGSIRSIGSVGARDIAVTDYASALNQELRSLSAQFGTNITFEQAEALGVVASVRAQVVSAAALDNETARIGLSVGDGAVQREVLRIPAFQGVTGAFDRAAYADTLRQNGLTEPQFEAKIRDDAARSLLQGAIAGGVRAPPAYVDALVQHQMERRSFKYAEVTAAVLTAPLATPTDADLQAQYDANPATFTAPETRDITYVLLTPEMLIDKVSVDDDALRAEYAAREAEFMQPERRLVERLVYPTDADAAAAMARLNSGAATFDGLVTERGLSLADIDLGEVSATDLGDAGPGVFALTEPGVAGPLPSTLGPALYRMNGILVAQETSFEDARSTLSQEIALDRARRMVLESAPALEDRLAEGATLEDLAGEGDMELGTIAYAAGVTDGIAAYDAFRSAAEAVTDTDFPELKDLEDGGIFALRLDALKPPALKPFAEVRDAVTADWTAAETIRALTARAEDLAPAVAAADAGASDAGATATATATATDEIVSGDGGAGASDPALAGLVVVQSGIIDRRAFIEGVPPEVITAAFALDPEGAKTRVLTAAGSVWLIALADVAPADRADPETVAMTTQIDAQASQGIASDALSLFTGALEASAGVRIDEAAVNAVHAQLR